MTITQNPPIYEHDADSIIPHLVPHLPHSISLLRRIQHSLSYPSSTAKILATFPPTQQPLSPPSSCSSSDEIPWLAARVDLFRGRETQIVVYSSLEKTASSIDPVVPVTDRDHDNGSIHSRAKENGAARHAADTAALDVPVSTEIENQPMTVAKFTAPPLQLVNAQFQFQALLSYIKINLLPDYLSSLSLPSASDNSHQTVSGSTSPSSENSHLIPAPPPQAFLIGSLHTGLYALLMRSGVYGHGVALTNTATPANTAANVNAADLADPLPGLKIYRVDYPPYFKYFFRRGVFSSDDGRGKEEDQDQDQDQVDAGRVSLPHGYRYHDRKGRTGVQDIHLDLVQSRTHIPRSRAQLASMPSVAIYHDTNDTPATGTDTENETPIAWGFLGLDGALATLHVEPGHRGKGLALCLSREVMRRGMGCGVFGTGKADGDLKLGLGYELGLDDQLRDLLGAWVHTEVAQYNRASRRVMEKIGGEVLSTVVWMVVEVCG